jgi:hypothetical protein
VSSSLIRGGGVDTGGEVDCTQATSPVGAGGAIISDDGVTCTNVASGVAESAMEPVVPLEGGSSGISGGTGAAGAALSTGTGDVARGGGAIN